MKEQQARVGLSLRTKWLLFTFGVVAALLGLSLGVIRVYVEDRIHTEVALDLEKTRAVFDRFLQERGLWLRSQSLVVAEDPRFNATVDLPFSDLEQHARTVIREARRFQALIGSHLFTVTDRRGRALAQIRVSHPPRAWLSQIPAVAAALQGDTAISAWRTESQDYQIVSAPVREGEEVIGALAAGFVGRPVGEGMDAYLRDWGQAEKTRQLLQRRDAEGLAELLGNIQSVLGADLVAGTDRDGQFADLLICQATYGEDLKALPGISEALEGGEYQGLYSEAGRLFQLVVVPVFSQDQIVGTLSAGFGIDDRLARQLKAMTHSEVTFVTGGRVVASTWPEEAQRHLERHLRERPIPIAGQQPFEMLVGDERHLSLIHPFGAEMGLYLIQISLDQAAEFLHRIERLLLLIGAGVLLIAALLSFVGVARITRPVKSLVEGTRRLAAGELTYHIPVAARDEIGELAGSFNHMADSLAQSREALAESERRYRDLFDNAQDLVYTTDLEMSLTSVNRAGMEFLGLAADEMAGKQFYDLLAAEDARRLQAEDRRYLPGSLRPPFEARFIRAGGHLATLEVVSRWITEAGRPVGTHGVGRDITARREREQATHRFREQLAQGEKLRALGEMAAGVAHNFNNLLTVVLGNTELIEMRQDLPEAIRQDLRRITEAARRCSAIVRRIQTFGRPIDLNAAALVDLHQVIRDTVDITRPRWKTEPERQGRTVRIDLQLEPVPPITSQGAAWEEILSNLIFNAVDAMPRGGIITIAVRREGEELVLSMADTGTGMDEQTRRRVFEPFFTTKEPDRGTGLGLSTVWGLVQSMGGQIGVDSALGRGTTFTIRVGLASSPVEEEQKNDEEEADFPLEILVVDDEPLVLELLPPLLAGHRVDTAYGGHEGLKALADRAYDAIITDWVMPEISGLEIAEATRQRLPGAVVVLMTGWQLKGAAAERPPSVDLIFPKPFERGDVERLLRRVSRLVRQRQVRA